MGTLDIISRGELRIYLHWSKEVEPWQATINMKILAGTWQAVQWFQLSHGSQAASSHNEGIAQALDAGHGS